MGEERPSPQSPSVYTNRAGGRLESLPLCVRLAQVCPEHALTMVEGRSRRRGPGWGFLADR